MAGADSALAPGGLRLVQLLLNTRYGQGKRLHDVWPDRSAMEDWIREQRLITPQLMVTDGDYRRAIAMREAIRQLRRTPVVEAHNDATDALETLRGLASHLLLKLQLLSGNEVRLVPESGGVDGFLAGVLAEMYTAMANGTWMRLKICHNTACSRAFYDNSKNQAGVWCSTRTCGNRMHARAYRQLQKTRERR